MNVLGHPCRAAVVACVLVSVAVRGEPIAPMAIGDPVDGNSWYQEWCWPLSAPYDAVQLIVLNRAQDGGFKDPGIAGNQEGAIVSQWDNFTPNCDYTVSVGTPTPYLNFWTRFHGVRDDSITLQWIAWSGWDAGKGEMGWDTDGISVISSFKWVGNNPLGGWTYTGTDPSSLLSLCETTLVPEPTSGVLLMLGLCGLLSRRRRADAA